MPKGAGRRPILREASISHPTHEGDLDDEGAYWGIYSKSTECESDQEQGDADNEDDDPLPALGTGCVLMPSPNPYNKSRRLSEANDQLSLEEFPPEKTNTKVKFDDELRAIEHFSGSEEQVEENDSLDDDVPEEIVTVDENPPEEKEVESLVVDEVDPDESKIRSITIKSSRKSEEDNFSEEEENSVIYIETARVSANQSSQSERTFSYEDNSDNDGTITASGSYEIDHLSEHFSKTTSLEPSSPDEDKVEDSNDNSETKEKKRPRTAPLPLKIKKKSLKAVSPKTVEGEHEIKPKTPARRVSSSKSFKQQCLKLSSRIEKEKGRLVRPSTAPSQRTCCSSWSQGKLPQYNGLRSEYGLSADQIQERKRKIIANSRAMRMKLQHQRMEEEARRYENERTFNCWLEKKKKEALAKEMTKGVYMPYNTTQLAPKISLAKKPLIRKKVKPKDLEFLRFQELFKNANAHDQRTYRIYLGLSIE